MIHHADFAVPVTQPLSIETDLDRPEGEGKIVGRAIALGWWVDPGHDGESTGTLYLVVDPEVRRRVCVAQGSIVAVSLPD